METERLHTDQLLEQEGTFSFKKSLRSQRLTNKAHNEFDSDITRDPMFGIMDTTKVSREAMIKFRKRL